jgi:predicted dehydrogenase
VHHAATITAAMRAGERVYVEKPLATTVPAAREVLATAAATSRPHAGRWTTG